MHGASAPRAKRSVWVYAAQLGGRWHRQHRPHSDAVGAARGRLRTRDGNARSHVWCAPRVTERTATSPS